MFVYNIPYLVRRELCRILDFSDDWKALGDNMGYSIFDIKEIENKTQHRGSSAMDMLLNKWGQQNHTVEELFVLLWKLEHITAMQCIKSLVSPQYQRLLDRPSSNVERSRTMNLDTTDQNNSNASTIQPSGNANQRESVKIVNGPPYESRSDIQAKPLLMDNALLSIPYSELLDATENWNTKNVLGTGGFGKVYKGTWKYTSVAIKQLKNSNGVKVVNDEILRELKYLNGCRHDNVLPIYGYSIGGNEACLVYQLMTGGSLDDRLKCKKDKLPLTWKQRLNIAQGVARGLQFLHTVTTVPLIHGDIKPGNILLDAMLEPRIGDFGLARQGPVNDEVIEISKVHGTLPYLPDEFLRCRKFSIKVDTYSFGIVLFEIVTGLPAYEKERPQRFLKDYVLEFISDRSKDTTELQDMRLVRINETEPLLCHNMVNIGLECVDVVSKRPHMVDVWKKLASLNIS